MEEILEDIPPELIAQLEQLREDEAQQSEEKRRKLDELGKKIAKIRDEAVAHRRASGIEDIWREDEEYYEGADDLNRGTETFLKSRSLNGGLTSERANESTKCTAFFNITRVFYFEDCKC